MDMGVLGLGGGINAVGLASEALPSCTRGGDLRKGSICGANLMILKYMDP